MDRIKSSPHVYYAAPKGSTLKLSLLGRFGPLSHPIKHEMITDATYPKNKKTAFSHTTFHILCMFDVSQLMNYFIKINRIRVCLVIIFEKLFLVNPEK